MVIVHLSRAKGGSCVTMSARKEFASFIELGRWDNPGIGKKPIRRKLGGK